jgi:hypothetical protein
MVMVNRNFLFLFGCMHCYIHISKANDLRTERIQKGQFSNGIATLGECLSETGQTYTRLVATMDAPSLSRCLVVSLESKGIGFQPPSPDNQLSRSLQYLATRQESQIPFTPVRGNEECKTYSTKW